jgi:hypothetical protein
VVGAVLVADHPDDRDLAEGEHPTLVVDLPELGVEPLEDHLADRGGLAEPDRRRDHQDVGGEHLLADRRPAVVPSLVGGDAELHAVVDDPQHLDGHLAGGELGADVAGEQRGAGLGG